MDQIGSCDKVAYQQHVDGAIARVSCPDGGKWMVELGPIISSQTLQNVMTGESPYADVQESAAWCLSGQGHL